MKTSDLNNVLDYIYYGEIQIYQHDLDRFLGIAGRLKLDGLMEGEQLKKEDDSNLEHILEENIPASNNDLLVPQNENQRTKDVKIVEKPIISVQASDIQNMEELDQKIEESYSKDSNGSLICHYCAKSFKYPSLMKDHVEIHFEGLSFPCTLCDTILRSRNALRIHSKRKH